MKYAFVTGGSRGIGRAVALKLAAQGWPVVINYRSNHEAAQAVVDEITAAGGKAELLPFDVADAASADAALDQWEQQHPDDYVAVLVNNAGIRRDGMMFMMGDDDWHRVIDTTLDGFFYITRRLLKHMMPRRRGGRIINMTSLSGLKGLPGQTNYSAAKGGIIAATKALAQEVARRGITVNAVAPGFIKTDMTEALDEAALKKMIPANRFGTPEEVADLVAFLVSPNAGYITGNVVSINGGMYT